MESFSDHSSTEDVNDSCREVEEVNNNNQSPAVDESKATGMLGKVFSSFSVEDEDYGGFEYSLTGQLSEIISYFMGLVHKSTVDVAKVKDQVTDSENWDIDLRPTAFGCNTKGIMVFYPLDKVYYFHIQVRMRSLAALAHWEELNNLCREYWTPAEPAARLEMTPIAILTSPGMLQDRARSSKVKAGRKVGPVVRNFECKGMQNRSQDLDLKKCNIGTRFLRKERWIEDTNVSDDLDATSDASDGRITKHAVKDRSLSTAGSRSSFDSMDDSFPNGLIGIQDSVVSSNTTQYTSYQLYDSPRSIRSPYTSGKHMLSQRQDCGKVSNSVPASPLRSSSGSIEFVPEALLDESEVKEEAAYNLLLQENNNIQIELEEEVKFQRDLNDNLSLQLLKRQQEGKHENSLAGEGKAEGDMLQKLNLEIETLESDCLVKDMEIERQKRISGLEPQLRYLTEKSRLEIQHSETRVANLQAEIRRIEEEMEANKVDMRQKLENMQKKWLEAQEEYCSSLEALACVGNIAKAMGPAMESHVCSLLDAMFSAGLSSLLVESLEQITISIPSLLPTIQDRLLESISEVLSKPQNAHTGASATPSRVNTASDMQQMSELTGSDFKVSKQIFLQFCFIHDLLEFARESVVVYLEDDDGATRKDAALCCYHREASYCSCRLTVRNSIFSSLHRNGGFDNFLAQADSLTAIFATLDDEDLQVRKYAISVAGRLSEKNPAYVLALRRHLIKSLTYLAQSADSNCRGESAKLLGCLIRS
ncbi:hypothetical protein LXL04_020551 [Taraxacum kok-saghyz]